VGKSWLCGRLAETFGLAHAQASELLKRAKLEAAGRALSSEELRTGAVVDNQALLISEFEKLAMTEGRDILFDGHTVIDAGASLIEIPFDVIAALAPNLVVFIWDEPAVIVERRARDRGRQRPERTVEQLRAQQDRAEQLAKEYAQRLGAPFCRLQSGELEGALGAVRAVLGEAAGTNER
jgi:adenylate kinase